MRAGELELVRVHGLGAAGYHVYRGASTAGPFTRLTSSPTAALRSPIRPPGGRGLHGARREVESTPSGTFFNGSQGAFFSADGSGVPSRHRRLPDQRFLHLSFNQFVRALERRHRQPKSGAGFAIGGAGTSGTMPVLIRATGPALQDSASADFCPILF